jgi:hypothetical protein
MWTWYYINLGEKGVQNGSVRHMECSSSQSTVVMVQYTFLQVLELSGG